MPLKEENHYKPPIFFFFLEIKTSFLYKTNMKLYGYNRHFAGF